MLQLRHCCTQMQNVCKTRTSNLFSSPLFLCRSSQSPKNTKKIEKMSETVTGKSNHREYCYTRMTTPMKCFMHKQKYQIFIMWINKIAEEHDSSLSVPFPFDLISHIVNVNDNDDHDDNDGNNEDNVRCDIDGKMCFTGNPAYVYNDFCMFYYYHKLFAAAEFIFPFSFSCFIFIFLIIICFGIVFRWCE